MEQLVPSLTSQFQRFLRSNRVALQVKSRRLPKSLGFEDLKISVAPKTSPKQGKLLKKPITVALKGGEDTKRKNSLLKIDLLKSQKIKKPVDSDRRARVKSYRIRRLFEPIRSSDSVFVNGPSTYLSKSKNFNLNVYCKIPLKEKLSDLPPAVRKSRFVSTPNVDTFLIHNRTYDPGPELYTRTIEKKDEGTLALWEDIPN